MNVIYLGDTVVIPGDDETYYVSGYASEVLTTNGSEGCLVTCDIDFFTTPDGETVTDFGGANIDVIRGEGKNAHWWCLLQNCVCSEQRWQDRDRAVEFALTLADSWYGPWHREHTITDLIKRGLM